MIRDAVQRAVAAVGRRRSAAPPPGLAVPVVKRTTIEARVTRADGTVEELGIVSSSEEEVR